MFRSLSTVRRKRAAAHIIGFMNVSKCHVFKYAKVHISTGPDEGVQINMK